MIEFDVMTEESFIQIVACDVRQCLLIISKGYKFFKMNEYYNEEKQWFIAYDIKFKYEIFDWRNKRFIDQEEFEDNRNWLRKKYKIFLN